jgi:gas vesicle protein
MTSNCQHCCHENESGSGSSSFIFGIIVGAIIGAIVAVLIYKNNKGKVFEQLKENLEKYFQNLMGYSKTEDAPKTKESTKETRVNKETIPVVKEVKSITKKPAPKMFVKPKK